MKKVLKAIDDHAEELILVLLMSAIVLVMLYQIIRRYIFNDSLSWSEEFCRYCFIWFMFIGYSYSVHQKIDLRMDAVVSQLPGKIQRLVNLLGELICFGLTVLLFVSSFRSVQAVIRTGETSTGLHLPMWVVYLSMIIGYGMAVFRYIQRLIREFVRKQGEEKKQ
ncbi:TRAP transporter small permease [Hominifimenecus sp. rT4P-3]|uniref:TRAP transporter small permease n=1 Tax=Hominifimenecus sp. rT4P-3 TaxID=3242979 RepID=UPI003DA51EAB